MTTPSSPHRRAKTLYRDPIDKKLGGVAAGVANYFDIDTTLTRAVWAASVFIGGFGLVLYVILWFILDEDPEALSTLETPPVEPVGTLDSAEALDEAEEEIDSETFEAGL